MSDEKNKSLWDVLSDVSEAYQEGAKQYSQDCDDYWEKLPYEDKLMAFYSVIKRVYKGDVIDQGSYRHVLYDEFGFGPDAYGVGMECRYLELHNIISYGIDAMDEKSRETYVRKD